MPRHWEPSKDNASSSHNKPSRIRSSIESRRIQYHGNMPAKYRTRRSSTRSRRSRSPRPKKSLSMQVKRRPPMREKRTSDRSTKEDTRPQKRPRGSPRNRSKTPPSRRLSRDRPHSFGDGKDIPSDKPRSTSQLVSSSKRDDVGDRFHSGDKYIIDRSIYRGSEKDVKKIGMSMTDMSSGNDSVKRSVVNPEDITVVRRIVTSRGTRDYRKVDNSRLPRSVKYELSPPLWTQRSYPYSRGVNHEESARYPSESSRSIFDRDEIISHRRKYEDDERDRRRGVISSPVHMDRRHYDQNTSEGYRTRDAYYDDGRDHKSREYSNVRSLPREYDSRAYEKQREEREEFRYPPQSSRARSRSYERGRDYAVDRKERYDERESHRTFRRTPERGRPDERLLRRHPSPGDSRRHFDDYRIMDERRGRSLERRDLEQAHYRDDEFVSGERFSSIDYISKSHSGYYENENRENTVSSPPRGRSRPVSVRGRGLLVSRGYTRSTEIIMRPGPPLRPTRASFIPRGPGAIRRLPFPPRKSFRGSYDDRH